jgi:hypothetical protein
VDAAIDVAAPDVARPPSDACTRSPEDLAGGGLKYEYQDMIVRGAGLTRWNGRSIHVYTIDFQTRRPLGYGTGVIREGIFELRLPGAYHRFTYQPVMVYLDVDGDGVCNVAAGDVATSFLTSGHNLDQPIEVGTGLPLNPDVDGGEPSKPSDPKVCDAINACH